LTPTTRPEGLTWIQRTVPGTGLPVHAFTALVAASTALFLWWGGALWSAPPEASHVARFAASYLAVIPAAALLLIALRQMSAAHLLGTVGMAWALKMLITFAAYHLLARGTATELQPAPPRTASASPRAVQRYRPSAGPFAAGAISGAVRDRGAPARAVVYLELPPPGAPPPPRQAAEIQVRDLTYVRPFQLVHLGDPLLARSLDPVLHTLQLSLEGGGGPERSAHPLPPAGAAVPVPLSRVGLHCLSCANHRSEEGWLLVLDHPYSAMTDDRGHFRLDQVPAGAVTLVALSLAEAADPRALGRVVELASGGTATLDLDLAAARPLLPARRAPEAIR
jgi:hypothetical protein